MDVLRDAAVARRLVVFEAGSVVSSVVLLPVAISSESFAFYWSDRACLRITKEGVVDVNGNPHGPYTEFRATVEADGALALHGVKSQLWLGISNCEFLSSVLPAPLSCQVLGRAPVSGWTRLRLKDGSAELPWHVRIVRTGGQIMLTTDTGNLACNERQIFHRKGKEGKWATWQIGFASEGITFRNIGHNKYLSMLAGSLQLTSDPTSFSLEECAAWNDMSQKILPVNEKALTKATVDDFKRDGYIVLHEAVPLDLVRDALRCINHEVGNAGANSKLWVARCAARLFNLSPILWSAVNILLGIGNVKPFGEQWNPQVALRYPQSFEIGHDIPDVRPGTDYHIDGMADGTPGRKPAFCPFTLLCGVALSAQTKPNMGNLHVFPGSHLNQDLHSYYWKVSTGDSSDSEMLRKPDLGTSMQILLDVGDVIVVHPLLAHRVGMNSTEHIRYQLYYRVHHTRHQELRKQVIQDPWIEFNI